jgi:polyhydroxybutyrate depolymerase
VIDLGRGPVTVHVPQSYNPEVPTPLVFLLHGYGGNGDWQESYFQFLPLAEEHGFLYLYPNGTVDQAGNRFWNATDACCDFYGSGVDDSGYLLALVDEIKAQLNVDSRRVFFAGHSNGGFMSYRMACDHSETIAAIASLAGATFADPADCSPDSPVHVLQIHGTADAVIHYEGGSIGEPYPGAVETVEQWASFDGCADIGVLTPPPLDLDASIPGDETDVYRYDTDCDPDGSAELWSIVGGSHVPPLTENFSPLVIEFLLTHPKSGPAAADDERVTTMSTAGHLLLPATPNPSRPETRLRYWLTEASPVILIVHDVAGRAIRTLVRGEERAAGYHQLVWDGCGNDGESLPSGIYFVTLEAGLQTTSQKVIMVR